ncbi:MAG: hypothetical protein KJ927_21050, partial [Candidatus Eisenbacteria bacterium]|nr:hypothetical protein [Candidatus Eisenbacteria bacterium]
ILVGTVFETIPALLLVAQVSQLKPQVMSSKFLTLVNSRISSRINWGGLCVTNGDSSFLSPSDSIEDSGDLIGDLNQALKSLT